ncbi:PREDICTED: artemin [Thamnophis sirtalis]|uniref:Artemin n=1 Tax=Thamnophis sirtalis TaxID=35019 RepID=A0A6I9XT15_9SAUR|nr:PREDICTED: artemin [Thamnophis sirtalis]
MEWRVDRSRHRLDRTPSSRRSLPVQQARFRESGLWSTLTILSLFAGTLITTSGCLVSSASKQQSRIEPQSLAAWNQQSVKNISIRDLSTSGFLRFERSRPRSRFARRNSRMPANGRCRLHSLSIKVQDLGLGYETKEFVLFNYCSGTCDRTNYDEVMNYIMRQGVIGAKYKNSVSQVCCRPIKYENFSFLDVYNVWQTVHKGSAVECDCVG